MALDIKALTFTKSSFDITVKKYDGRLQVTDPITVKNQIYEALGDTANNALRLGGELPSYYTNASHINTGTLVTTVLPLSGVSAGTYGNTSQIPVITVDQYGRVSNVSMSAVAGVLSFSYSSANNTFAISTGDGSQFNATITDINGLVIDGGTF